MYATTTIQLLLERTKQPPIITLSTQPGVKSVYRVIVYAMNNSLYHSIATICCHAHMRDITVGVVYDGLFANQPLQHTITTQKLAAFRMALHQAKFETLTDQSPPPSSRDHICWWLEHATGRRHRRVQLWPQHPAMPYSIIVNAIDAHLPQTIREIQR